MAVGKLFKPKSVVGMDIDQSLIQRARKNLRVYSSCARPAGLPDFPRNLPMVFGPLEPPGGVGKDGEEEGNEVEDEEEPFPKNIRYCHHSQRAVLVTTVVSS